MSIRNEPCGWTPDAPCASGPCCPDVTDPDIEAQAKDLAASLLWMLTGRRFGLCTVTVRPCKPERACGDRSLTDIIYWDQRRFGIGSTSMGVLSFFPTLIDGSVFNIACGCNQGCCTCQADCEVFLPGPIAAITNVTVDGVVRNPSTYKLYDHHKLVFLTDSDGDAHCPPCQDYNKPLGETNTWSVTYTIGEPVPEILNFAAGLYACELAKLLVNDDSCQLPKTVQSVTRRGTDIIFADPFKLAENGLTGLPAVDLIIKAINPNKLANRSRVWSPDLPRVRREH